VDRWNTVQAWSMLLGDGSGNASSVAVLIHSEEDRWSVQGDGRTGLHAIKRNLVKWIDRNRFSFVGNIGQFIFKSEV
jgi:hypothetical protein